MLKRRVFGGFVVLASFFSCMVSTGWAVNCTCSKPGDLQACVNSTPPGSTITVVGPATCYENLTLVQNLDSLVANNTKGNVVIQAADSGKPVISVAGTGLAFISGFTITGGTFGIDWDLGNGMVYNNTIQNCSIAGINVGGAFVIIGATRPTDLTPSPNTIMNCPIGVLVTSHSGAGIVGNTIKSCKTAGIVVDSSSQADIAGNTIDSCTNAISVSENSSIRLSDRPFSIFPLWGLLNKTDTSAKNTGAAILCTTGGAIRGYEGALAGSVPISYDSTCIENLKTNTSPIIGTWTLVSATFSNPPAQVSFYPDGAGQAGGRGLTWSISGTVLTMTLNNGKTGTGALTWGTGNSTFTWKFTGTIVTGGGTVVMKRQ